MYAQPQYAQPQYAGFADITNYKMPTRDTVKAAAPAPVSDQENQLRLYRQQQMLRQQKPVAAPVTVTAGAPLGYDPTGLDDETASQFSVDTRGGWDTSMQVPSGVPAAVATAMNPDVDALRLMQENLVLRQQMTEMMAKQRVAGQEAGAVTELVNAVRQVEQDRSKLIDVSKLLQENLAKAEKARTADAVKISQLQSAAHDKDAYAKEAAEVRVQMEAVAAQLEKKKQDEYQNLTQMADEQDAIRVLRAERDTLAKQLVAATAKGQQMERAMMMAQQQMQAQLQAMAARLQHAEATIHDLAEENKDLRRDAKRGGGSSRRKNEDSGSGSGSYSD